MKKPNFFCLGASKSGTTSIYKVLNSHPEIFVSNFKEPHFFDSDSNFRKGLDWYLSSFYKNVKNEKIISDFTPTYLYNKDAPSRIKNTFGSDLKFMIILRDPVDRAYSHYLHTKRDGMEKKSFLESLEEEKIRLVESDFLSNLHYSYIAQSKYFEMISRYFNLFPESSFKIYIFEEDFNNNDVLFFKDLFKFLNLKNTKNIKTDIRINVASQARLSFLKKILSPNSFLVKIFKILIPSIPLRRKIRNNIQALNNKPVNKNSLDNSMKKLIFEKYFKEDVRNLEKFLKRDLSVWNK